MNGVMTPLRTQLTAVQDQLLLLNGQVNTTNQSIAAMRQNLDIVRAMSTVLNGGCTGYTWFLQLCNMKAREGVVVPFRVINFINGTDPTAQVCTILRPRFLSG